MYLARPHGFRRLERPSRPDRRPRPSRSRSKCPLSYSFGLSGPSNWPSRTLQKYAPILEPFCNGPKTEVALINVVQVYCYEDTRIIKAFPQILKVCFLSKLHSLAALIIFIRFCIIRTVFLIKPLYTGTRRAQNPRADSISSKAPKR